MTDDGGRRDRILSTWADDLDRKGFSDIKVEMEGYPSRPEGFEHVPDIVAIRKDGRRFVGILWTAETLNDGKEMFTRLMSYAYHGDVVMLLVPFDRLDEAETLMAEWGLATEMFVQGYFE